MDESNGWGFRRYVTLLVVLALHMALLAALVMTSRTRPVSASTNHPIELLFISPTRIPKIRAENSPPRRLSGDTAISITLPVLDAPSSSQLPPTSGSDGEGSGVDWRAEARRAVQAFEIRSHQPPSNSSVSGAPEDDSWWPRTRHHAGDKFKTANGDWIVWINSSCYQIASSASPPYAPGAALPQTVCSDESSSSRGDPPDGVPADKKAQPRK